MLIAVDVGNSGVKAGLFDRDELQATVRIEPSEIATSLPLPALLGIEESEATAIVAVSVHRETLDILRGGPGARAVVLGGDLPLLVVNRYRRPEEVGHDRLVNAAAAHDRAGGTAIVVDLGSAVTVDAVSAEGEFLGGAIAPGLRALTRGLGAAAPALPAWDGEPPPEEIPRSTRDAIRAGIVTGLAGLTARLIGEIEADLGADPGSLPVILTGGDAGLVAPRLDRPFETVPHLTLHGVRLLYDRARRA